MTKEMTPSGLPRSGYLQAIDNVIYHIDLLSHDVFDGMDTTEVLEVLSNIDHPKHNELKTRSEQIDNIIPIIAETYGFSISEVEDDIDIAFAELVLKTLI